MILCQELFQLLGKVLGAGAIRREPGQAALDQDTETQRGFCGELQRALLHKHGVAELGKVQP